jgi:hypothetical protein
MKKNNNAYLMYVSLQYITKHVPYDYSKTFKERLYDIELNDISDEKIKKGILLLRQKAISSEDSI